jgi:hypothetical protein
MQELRRFSPKRHAGVKIKIAQLLTEEEMSMLKSNNCCEKSPTAETGKAKQSNPIIGLDRPRGFQEVGDPRFQDNQHMKVVSLSALRTGQLYP